MSAAALPLLARLKEASTFPKAVRHYESDPWSYLRRKLGECEAPLREYKESLFAEASARLLEELRGPFPGPDALHSHKEVFEKLLAPGDYADLSFHLDLGGEPVSKRLAVKEALAAARVKTLFETEALPSERRGKPWEDLVADTARRLEFDQLKDILLRGPLTDRRRAYIARRARRNLSEFLTVTRGQEGLRDEITLFVLTRVEAAIAALLRLLNA